MPRSWKPDTSKYSRVKDLTSKAETDKHIELGWEYIDKSTFVGGSHTFINYRVGWPKNAGEPNETLSEGGFPKFDSGGHAN